MFVSSVQWVTGWFEFQDGEEARGFIRSLEEL
jgi:hypothetical protein